METRTTKRRQSEAVKQFSIFAQNQVGRLADLIRLLNSHDVHVMALTILDTTDSSIIRMIVDDPDKARALFSEHDFAFTECEVLVVEIAGEGDMKHVLSALLEAEVNIHYIYSCVSRPREKCALVISLEDGEVAAQSLRNHQFKVLLQNDISR
ncbi:MAG: acetolactate synthase [Opitutales bacterium]